jgi:hypothetical protein
MNWTEPSQRNKSKWPKKHMKIPGHKGNANENHFKFPPRSCLNGYHQEHQQQQMLKRNSHTLLVGM